MRVRYTRRALRQLDSILTWISQDRPTAARGQIQRIEHAVDLIGQFPQMGHTGISTSTWEFVVPATPYIVVYRISNDEVQVLSIVHGAQNRKPAK